jgi:uncharacterized protein YdeI (YjbR/CyaY-like superfamily)
LNSAVPVKDDLAVRPFASREKWAAWLEKNHASAPGIWLKFAKKASGIKTVTFAEAVEVALCYGWIDGQSQSLDETWYLQRFTPRRPKSVWSKINRARALELIEKGEMKPAGLAEVERAQADGRWDAAYDSPSTATVPDDFKKALKKSPKAEKLFEGLDSQNRYAILHRIQTARKPETRARRIEQLVSMLAEGKTLYPTNR